MQGWVIALVVILLVIWEFWTNDDYDRTPVTGGRKRVYTDAISVITELRDRSGWRRSLIMAIAGVCIGWWLLFKKFPSLIELAVIGGLIFLISMVCDNWFRYHYINYNTQILLDYLSTLYHV